MFVKLIRTVVRGIKFRFGALYAKFDAIGYARSIGVKVGENCRLIKVDFGSEPYLVTLGNHVSATRTRFVTHDGGVWTLRDTCPDLDVIEPITVGNNVFFGVGAIVLPGVTVGDNVIIGAGSVVTRDIPSNNVAAGVPARVIKTLEEYSASAAKKGLRTKGLSSREKREYLQDKFRVVNSRG